MKEFDYSADNDFHEFRVGKHTIGGITFNISACTVAGIREPSTAPKPNEDAFSLVTSEDRITAAVFDGTSSLKQISSLGETTGARFASHFVKEQLDNSFVQQYPKEIIRELNKRLLERTLLFDEASLEDTHTLPSTTATIVQIVPSENTMYLSHLGDSYCVVYYKDGHSEVVTDNQNANFDNGIFEQMKQVSKEKGITIRQAREDERIKHALLDMFQYANNRPDGRGRGILNGETNAEQYIQDISIPLESVRAILIASDGLLPPSFSEQTEEDREKTFDILINKGMEEMIKLKQKVEDQDPDRNYARYKHSDDATGIFIKIN